jgi:hypothetical protein
VRVVGAPLSAEVRRLGVWRLRISKVEFQPEGTTYAEGLKPEAELS